MSACWSPVQLGRLWSHNIHCRYLWCDVLFGVHILAPPHLLVLDSSSLYLVKLSKKWEEKSVHEKLLCVYYKSHQQWTHCMEIVFFSKYKKSHQNQVSYMIDSCYLYQTGALSAPRHSVWHHSGSLQQSVWDQFGHVRIPSEDYFDGFVFELFDTSSRSINTKLIAIPC